MRGEGGPKLLTGIEPNIFLFTRQSQGFSPADDPLNTSGERIAYRSTPLSSRDTRKNLSLNDSCINIPNSSGQCVNNLNSTSLINSRYTSNCNPSCSNTIISNSIIDTPNSNGQCTTPSSVRFRSRISTAKGSTSHYVSPKKKLNFDG